MANGPSIDQIVEQIRTALFGKDVRENIALGIEKCYEETSAISVQQIGQTDDYKMVTTVQ